MVRITDLDVPCFARLKAGCKILTTECEGIQGCPFYKPKECEDWIRAIRKGEEWLIPPEEYYEEM